MFFFCNYIDFTSYADDNTPYCIGKTPEEVISWLEKSSNPFFNSFKGIKAIPDKCHLLLTKKWKFLRQIIMKTGFLIQDLKYLTV